MDTAWPDEIDDMHGAFLRQSFACAALGSPMYGTILEAMAHDYATGGRIRDLVAGSSHKPVHDATPLRLLGTLHRIVLEGRDEHLTSLYPSVGGVFASERFDEILAAIDRHFSEIRRGLASQVQTNEVGRSVVHLSIARWLGLNGHTEFVLREVGASAGLNLSFDKFHADTGSTTMGWEQSPVRFNPDWFVRGPEHGASARCIERSGSDPYAIDISQESEAIRLKSFVWPDQTERFGRIVNAITIARDDNHHIDVASADRWLPGILARHGDRPTVVFHSIVWQYLDNDVRDGLRHALRDAASLATNDAPIIWARMEPAGPIAAVHATIYDSSPHPTELHLANVGYHGQSLDWLV